MICLQKGFLMRSGWVIGCFVDGSACGGQDTLDLALIIVDSMFVSLYPVLA